MSSTLLSEVLVGVVELEKPCEEGHLDRIDLRAGNEACQLCIRPLEAAAGSDGRSTLVCTLA